MSKHNTKVKSQIVRSELENLGEVANGSQLVKLKGRKGKYVICLYHEYLVITLSTTNRQWHQPGAPAKPYGMCSIPNERITSLTDKQATKTQRNV